MPPVHDASPAAGTGTGEVVPEVDPDVVEVVLAVLAEAPAGARLDELVRSPALSRLRAGPPEVMRALAGLHAAGLVRSGPLRRWRLTADAGLPGTADGGLGGEALVAVPADVRRMPASSPDPAVAGGAAEIDGWAFAARYLAHAARVLAEEERARIDVFADRAGELVRPLLPRGPWWPETGERVVLRIERERLAGPFQAALARRAEDEVAVVWGLRVREPRGSDVPVWTPLVVWPALWRPDGDHIEIELTTPLPTVDTSALRVRGRGERRRIAEWLGLLADEEERALAAVDPPELGRRLGPLLGGQLREPLDPLRVRRTMPLSAGEGIYDLFALVLLDRTRYGGGAVRELRDLAAAVERGEFRETALATLFVDVPATERDGWLFEPLELSGSQLDAARDASVQPLTVITGPPGTASLRWWRPSPQQPLSPAARCWFRAAITGRSTRWRSACAISARAGSCASPRPTVRRPPTGGSSASMSSPRPSIPARNARRSGCGSASQGWMPSVRHSSTSSIDGWSWPTVMLRPRMPQSGSAGSGSTIPSSCSSADGGF